MLVVTANILASVTMIVGRQRTTNEISQATDGRTTQSAGMVSVKEDCLAAHRGRETRVAAHPHGIPAKPSAISRRNSNFREGIRMAFWDGPEHGRRKGR